MDLKRQLKIHHLLAFVGSKLGELAVVMAMHTFKMHYYSIVLAANKAKCFFPGTLCKLYSIKLLFAG